jgi:ribonuclease BN (tRNA processing enzyme)
MDILKEGGIQKITTLFTHYHHDHTQWLLLSPPTYIKAIHMELLGPVDQGIGPKEVLETLMKPPFHPVDSVEVKSHFSFAKIDHPAGTVLLFHPQGGKKKMELDEFERLENKNGLIPVGEGKYPIQECLVVKMLKTTHPEQTISYRFEERSTGKTFVFLTDHENTEGIALSLKRHIQWANLLIADAQYDTKTYETRTAGFGHWTGEYVTRLGEHCGVSHIGLTHHDPLSDDTAIEKILLEAEASKSHPDTFLFTCKDMETIDVI